MAGINLKVQIEINGQFVQAGHITGSSFRDAAFSYDESYITSSAARAISLSLPLSKKAFDTDGTVTLYEYDAKGQLSTVYYPYTKAMEDALKEEAEENRMPTVGECGINKYLDTGTRNSLSALLNRISWNYGSKILAMQLFIKESYNYDRNGNRTQKITPFGTIDYVYNEENLLVSSGWNGRTGIVYTYDKEGNLLIQESELKIIKYAYNAQNRIMYSEVIDKKEKTHSVSYYGYDAFGRRILEQDKDEAALRSLYDGFTFDVIKQSPTFTNGLFVDSNETGIRINITGKPTGDRYRYLEDTPQQDGNRYFHLDEGNYRNVSSRYKGSRTTLSVNGIIAGQNADGDISYFTTDLLGSVRSTTDGYGYVDKTYSYDAFGAIINSLLKRIDDLENQMQSFLATASGGKAFSNMYGNSEVMGVTQKVLTETINGLYELIFDALGIEIGDVQITISPDGFFSNEATVVNIAATADYGLFDFVKVYFDGEKVLEETSIKTFSKDLTIGKTTTIKVEAQVLGKLYTYEKTVTMASDFFIGAGATYEDVYNPQYTRPYDGNPIGQYTIEVVEGQRIIIILPTADVSKIEQIEMNDFNIPMDTTTFGIYTVYTSLNTYQAGTYIIDINY